MDVVVALGLSSLTLSLLASFTTETWGGACPCDDRQQSSTDGRLVYRACWLVLDALRRHTGCMDAD